MKNNYFIQYNMYGIKWKEFFAIEKIKSRKKELIILSVISFLILGVFFLFYIGNNKKVDSEEDIFDRLLVEENSEEAMADSDLENDKEETVDEDKNIIIVDIKGAVQLPGVYEMESHHRIVDCINKAGGFLEEAEQRSVNLAQKVEDQMVIYIPLEGEESLELGEVVESAIKNDTSVSDNQKINLNKATKNDLKTLSGIGEVKAESIISYRETNGFFEKTEDIKNVSGIGEATFEKIKDEIHASP